MTDELQIGTALDTRQRSSVLRSLPAVVLASLVLGLAVGATLRAFPAGGWMASTVDAFDVVGTMWVSAMRMTVIPLIVPLLIGSIAEAKSGRAVGRLGLITTAWFVALLVVVAALTASAAPLLFNNLRVSPGMTAGLRASVAAMAVPTGDASIAGWLKGLIPVNPIKAAADGTMLSIIVFSVAFGFSALAAPPELRSRVITFAKTLSAIMLVMVQAVLLLAPVGVFALTLVVGAKVGGTAFGVLGYFVAAQLVAVTAIVIALFALAVGLGRLSPGQAIRGAGAGMLVAAGTSSSLSALPAMIEGARDEWALPEETYSFILPLAVSTFKLMAASSWVLDALFISVLYGVPFGPAQLALAAGYAVLFNATVPGIPGGGVIVISPLFLALGLPLEGLAILFAVNPIVDRAFALGNVAADMTVAAIVGARPRSASGGGPGKDL